MHPKTETTELPYGLYIAIGVVSNNPEILALRRDCHKEDIIKDIVNAGVPTFWIPQLAY
jgi:hypothetical protein